MAIAALLTIPIGFNQSEAKTNMVYDQAMFNYIQAIVSQTGTTSFTENDDTRRAITTNTVTQDGSTYAVHTTTTADGITVNDENVLIIHNSDGTYRFVNTLRNIDIVFTGDESDYLQGRASQGVSRSIITLYDREHADEGEVISLTDDYRGCWGNYATFTAGVDTTDDTYVSWRVNGQFFAYCFIYQPFDKIEITHEGHKFYSSEERSHTDMYSANGEGWYSLSAYAYYD